MRTFFVKQSEKILSQVTSFFALQKSVWHPFHTFIALYFAWGCTQDNPSAWQRRRKQTGLKKSESGIRNKNRKLNEWEVPKSASKRVEEKKIHFLPPVMTYLTFVCHAFAILQPTKRSRLKRCFLPNKTPSRASRKEITPLSIIYTHLSFELSLSQVKRKM